MGIVEIAEDSVEDFLGLMDVDAAENIGREFFRGIGVTGKDGEAIAALIWELKHLEDDDRATESRIHFLASGGKEADKLMLAEYTRLAQEDDVTRSYYEMCGERAETAAKVLKSCGFSMRETEGQMVSMDLGGLSSHKVVSLGNVPDYIFSLDKLMVRQFHKGVTNCLFHSRRELLEDVDSLPMSWYESGVSCCCETDERINGFLLVHETPSGKLRAEMLTAHGPDYRENLMLMMRFSIRKALEKYPPETEVLVERHDDHVRALITYMAPGIKGMGAYCGERKEGRVAL
ncbi:MAG: hypothetical protein IKI75_03945 [Lachnospiraceae bacterium]|nr:hypothetical protein [Lachnospiraceae bacterium]